MTIIERNFFRLLSSGAFNSPVEVEPMSAWKWRQVFKMSVEHHVEALTFKGMENCSDQFFMRLPHQLSHDWALAAKDTSEKNRADAESVRELLSQLPIQQLRPILLGPWTSVLLRGDYTIGGGSAFVFFPFETQGHKADEWAKREGTGFSSPRSQMASYTWHGVCVEHRHRMMQLNSRRANNLLQRIIEQECCTLPPAFVYLNDEDGIETIEPTLSLLFSFTELVRAMMGEGISIIQIVDIGFQLRLRGHRVDFIKLQEWLGQLGLMRVAWMVRNMLVMLMGFTSDEVPFSEDDEKSASADMLADALLRRDVQKARYFSYMPGESFATMIASVAHSLNQVKE
jgi:hypothetical protein